MCSLAVNLSNEEFNNMEPVRQAFSRSVRMGEMQVGGNGDTLRTLLGSCIGLALYDRRRKIGGLAHIVLPESRGKTERRCKRLLAKT